MSFVKPLCVLCERPAADGAVQAVQVDKEKLQTWFLNVCEEELAEEIEEDDLICFFCIWHAEFLAKYVPETNGLVWWPANLDFLDGAAKQLRKKYFEGKAEQCWVQLETIRLPESETEENAEHQPSTSGQKKAKKCVFCGERVKCLSSHMRYHHKDAVRCEHRSCVTYFHTVEEKGKHTKEAHDVSRERKMLDCMFCERMFPRRVALKAHILEDHPEYPVRCDLRGCLSYFKTEKELKSHFEVTHKKEDEAKAFKCHFCHYKARKISLLSNHICRKHLQRTIKCEKCTKMFATKELLAKHVQNLHTYWVCKICSTDCVVSSRTLHLNKVNCSRCSSKFECAGLFKAHLQTCLMEALFKCDQCPKTFRVQSGLMYHVKRKHDSWHGVKHKTLGFECEPCKRYYPSAILLNQHLRRVHTKQGHKQCAHCPKSFSELRDLKTHLAEKHDLIERKFCCDECGKSFDSSRILAKHCRGHSKKQTIVSCTVCGKSMMAYTLTAHLSSIHGIIR